MDNNEEGRAPQRVNSEATRTGSNQSFPSIKNRETSLHNIDRTQVWLWARDGCETSIPPFQKEELHTVLFSNHHCLSESRVADSTSLRSQELRPTGAVQFLVESPEWLRDPGLQLHTMTEWAPVFSPWGRGGASFIIWEEK